MKILYGVSGEGFGHSSRAKKIIPFLLRRGHSILVMTYGQAYDVLRQEKGIEILKIEGIELIFDNGGLSLKKTFSENAYKLLENLKNWKIIKKRMDDFKPDVCISDMEPTVPIIRRIYKLPLICLDNQHRLTHLKIKVPKKYLKEYTIAKIAVDRLVSRADSFIILSFNKGKIQRDKEKTFVVEPILREEIMGLQTKITDQALVYMTKKDDKILAVIKKINQKFIVYGYGIEKQEENLIFKKVGPSFIEDLANTKAIIASAGFTLISEAIYLKKPYFAIPLKGQFEQALNALFLKQAGLGDFSEKPTLNKVKMFFHKLNFYEKNLEKRKVNPNEALEVLDKVLANIN